MDSSAQIAAALSSAVVRLGTYIFLQWIPGHHFPPIIVASVIVYLTCVIAYPEAFRGQKLTLKEAFPALHHHDDHAGPVEVNGNDDKSTLIGQSDQDPDPIIGPDEKSLIKVLLLGIPDWLEREYSYATIAFNVLLTLLTLDFVFRGPVLHPSDGLRFSRVGYVDTTSANVLFREPDKTQLPVYAYHKARGDSQWTTADRIYYLDDETDYTYPLHFIGLRPATAYTYSLSNNLSGTFVTAPPISSPAANKLTFITSSCIKANFPYNPIEHALSIPGLKHLSSVLQSLSSPASFMLFLGDFIYVDVPLRLSSTIQHYRGEYRRVYASPSWRLPGLSTLPWLHTLDDHEIANDWSAGNTTDPFPAASDPFLHYHVSVNPPLPPSSSSSSGSDHNTTYFQFTRGPASFFMLDTRRYRTDPEPKPLTPTSTRFLSFTNSTTIPTDHHQHTILGPTQLSALLTYLATPEPPHIHWKILATSVPFTQNWRFGTSDSWGGYLSERSLVLSAMHAAEAHLGVRVIILSGDRHEFAAVRFPEHFNSSIDEPSSGPHEFSVGPLSMFYLPIRTFKSVSDTDVAIKYIPDGNSKFGVIELQNLAGTGSVQRSLLRYTLYVNGVVAWEYVLVSPARGFEGYRSGETGIGGLWS